MLDGLYDKYGKRNTYLLICGIFIILNIIITFVAYKNNMSFTIHGEKIKYLSNKDGAILFKDSRDNIINIIRESSADSYPYSPISDKYRIEYKDEIIKVDYSNWMYQQNLIINHNGKEYKKHILFPKLMDIENEPFPIQLVYSIESTYNVVKENFYPVLTFLATPLIFLGVASLMYTEKMWRFQHIFTVKDGEPTEWAIFNIQLSGIILLGIAMFLPYINKISSS